MDELRNPPEKNVVEVSVTRPSASISLGLSVLGAVFILRGNNNLYEVQREMCACPCMKDVYGVSLLHCTDRPGGSAAPSVLSLPGKD